jgi:hypothetical protein
MSDPTTGRYNGSDVLIMVGEEVLAFQQSAARSQPRTMINLSAKGDPDEVSRPGRRPASTLSLDGLWSPSQGAYQQLLANYRADPPVPVTVVIAVDGDPFEQASAYVTQLDESWPDEQGATFSATLTISGGWTGATSS